MICRVSGHHVRAVFVITHSGGEYQGRQSRDEDKDELETSQEGQADENFFDGELSVVVAVDLLHHVSLAKCLHRLLIELGPVGFRWRTTDDGRTSG